MTRDPKEDVLDAIRRTERLIREARQAPEDDGNEQYVADLTRHLEKLNALLAKCDSN